uniref:Aminotransferase-like plant mobile domain-containing protein n=1 Tax=Fagus sylvatica TaxID=28930 RepID=A0A2N9IUI7_FAGSY
MASSSKKKMKGHGGSSSSRGGTSGSARVPRGSEDGSSGSDSVLGSPEPHGDVLGRPTVDPWYRSSERFPSVPASLQPPPADWEWLVLREDATADTTWTPDFQEIRDLQIQRNEMLAVPLVFDFQCRCSSIHSYFKMFEYVSRYRSVTAVSAEVVSIHAHTQQKLHCPLRSQEIEAVLADYIGRKNVALGTQAARFNSWMEHFLRIEDPSIRRAAFISYWLSKCVFGEHPAYSIKPLYFCLAVKIAAGVRFPLAPLLLGQLYTQLDLLHAEELVGASCHIVSTAFNSSVVHTFVWEHTLEYIRKGKKPYEIRKKFASMPEGVVTNVGDFQGDVPCCVSLGGQQILRPWSDSLLGQRGAHRVRRQFGFDQEVPAVMGVAAGLGYFTAGMANYWRELMAAMVEFKDSGREDISHLLESYTSPLPHPRLFGATNTMTTYANRQRLGYAVWHHEDSRWVIYGNHHPPLWLRDHPHIAAPGKVPSSRGKRNASAGTPTAVKRKQPDRSKKGEAVSKDSPAQASKRVKTTAGRVSKEALVLKTAVQDPVPADETAAEGVSASTSIAARVAARKSGRGIVYSEKRSKQRADTAARVPVEISDDLSSTSSSSGEGDVSGAAAKGAEDEDVEAAIAEETESESVEVTAAEEAESEDVETATAEGAESEDVETATAAETENAIINASSEEKDMEAGANIEDDEVSMGELGARQKLLLIVVPLHLPARPCLQKRVMLLRVAARWTLLCLTQALLLVNTFGGLGGGSLVSTDSERTASVTARVSTPPSPLGESGGTAPTPTITAAVVSATATAQGDETAPVITEEVPSPCRNMARVEPAEVAASEEPVQADVTPGSGVPVIEEELAQDPAADMEVTAPVAVQISPTRTARNSHGVVIEEGGRLQAAAVEFAVGGQPGLMSAAKTFPAMLSISGPLMMQRLTLKSFEYLEGGIRFLQALWEKLGDITEVHILEWKAVVQEAIEGGFKFGFILDYLRRLARDIFSRRVLGELREAEARVAALRDALNAVAPSPWDLASARRASAEARTESALQGLLS